MKAILKTPIQKLDKPIFSFRRTNEAAYMNSKILAAFNDNLGKAIAAQNDSPLYYGSEFRNTTDLSSLFHYHENKIKIVKIIQKVFCYHLDPINEETIKSELDTMVLRGDHK